MKTNLTILFASLLILGSCTTVDLFEKTTPIPGHAWSSSFKPSFSFTITDTTRLYQPYLIVRHNEKYNFSNIYVNLTVQLAGQDTAVNIRQDVRLATNEKGWLGSGMDDIYEHRSELGPPQPLRAGTYTFTLQQIMREDPLNNVMDVGIRVEKKL